MAFDQPRIENVLRKFAGKNTVDTSRYKKKILKTTIFFTHPPESCGEYHSFISDLLHAGYGKCLDTCLD